MHRILRPLPFALAAASLLAPAAAHAATKKTVFPAVSSVAPLKAKVGDQLTIKGSHFRAGAGKTIVVFQRTGKPAIFVKATKATTTLLTVRIPEKLGTSLIQKAGAPTATQFRLRVLTTRFARTWTNSKTSPTISPKVTPTTPGAGTPGATSLTGAVTPGVTTPGAAVPAPPAVAPTPPPPTAYEQCQAAARADLVGDADADGLSNGTEIALKYPTDPCNPDTDGDGLTDGYEYDSAKDLNGAAVPYPGSKPWPNPLDPTDAEYDFDGDGLYIWQEFALWKASGAHYPVTVYSDGNQNTGGTVPVAAGNYLDLDGDHNLTDDERDFDGDGLSNIIEYNFRGTQVWWAGIDWHYKPHDATSTAYIEPPYTLRAFSDLDPLNWDSDGDGIADGADDQDDDGWTNFTEMQLSRAQAGYRVQPFNPCLPDPHSRVCSRWVPLNGVAAWPPFDTVGIGITSGMRGDAIPFGWPVVNYDAWVTAGSHPTGSVPGPWDPSPWFSGGWDYTSGPRGS